MLTTLLLLLATPAHAACEAPRFTFVGQPECVELAWDGEHTQMRNGCEDALLVDQSVLMPSSAGPFVGPEVETELRDLSAFSVGLEGELYRVVAVVDEAACPAESLSPASEAEESQEDEESWLPAVMGVVTGFLSS